MNKCRFCKKMFEPRFENQKDCSLGCALNVMEQKERELTVEGLNE